MGINYVSKKEIVEILSETLDTIQGDFDGKTLISALEKLKEYPYVCDRHSKEEKKEWIKYLEEET
jgi:hypothetical protein